MLISGSGKQGVQCMAELVDQGCSAAVMQHAIKLVKAEGECNHWCLVLAAAQLASTAQCEVGCPSKLAWPACQVIPLEQVIAAALCARSTQVLG